MKTGIANRVAQAMALGMTLALAQSGAARADAGKIWHASYAGVEYGAPETDDWLVRLSCVSGAIWVAAGPGDDVTGETAIGRRSLFVQNLLRGVRARIVLNGRRIAVPGTGAPGPVGKLLAECKAARR